MKKIRFAIAGLRHAHIAAMADAIRKHPACSLVAIAEENESAAALAAAQWQLECTHHDYATLFATADFDVLAICDTYGRRGAIACQALKRGKHILSDKPLCTTRNELAAIREAAGDTWKIGCMLDLRDHGNARRARELLQSGSAGELLSVQFSGNHPLHYGRRSAWYFDAAQHGGTINDLAIHAVDLIPWLAGRPIQRCDFARNWSSGRVAGFRDGAQINFEVAGGVGIQGDVSYFGVESFQGAAADYWRFTLWCSQGTVEFNYHTPGVQFLPSGATAGVTLPPAPRPDGYLTAFLADLAGTPEELHTGSILEAADWTLRLQQMAD